MSDVWVVLIQDRHADADARPFSTEDGAIAAARAAAPSWVVPAELNQAMRDDGWVLLLPYGTEGDRVRVLRRSMDGQP